MNLLDDEFTKLVDIGVWPERKYFSPNDWLENFTSEELPYAKRLLKSFIYFSDDMITQMFRSNFMAISKSIIPNSKKSNYGFADVEWHNFLDNCYIVKVTGEEPSDADSGYIFTRMARDALGIPENRLKTVSEAFQIISSGINAHFVFVDDFVGSGNQFVDFWQGYFDTPHCFETLAQDTLCTFHYIPIICTEIGKLRIQQDCTRVNLIASHFVGKEYSALHNESYIWKGFQAGGPEFVQSASIRAGISQANGGVQDNGDGTKLVSWEGFHKLGLAIGFKHGTPDATLPIFYFNERGWKPLINRDSL